MKAQELLDETIGKAQTLEADEINEFFMTMGYICAGVVRGIHGEEFTKGYLKAALKDKKPIVIKAHRNH